MEEEEVEDQDADFDLGAFSPHEIALMGLRSSGATAADEEELNARMLVRGVRGVRRCCLGR